MYCSRSSHSVLEIALTQSLSTFLRKMFAVCFIIPHHKKLTQFYFCKELK